MSNLQEVATEIRKLYGPDAHRITLFSELTIDPPRVYVASSVLVYDRGDNLLLPRYEALRELDLDCAGPDESDPQDLVIEAGGALHPFGSRSDYELAFSGDKDLLDSLAAALLSEDALFDLYDALNGLARYPQEEFELPEPDDDVAERIAAYLYQSEFVTADEATVRDMAENILEFARL